MKKALFTIILIGIIGTMAFKSIAPAAAAPFTLTVDAAAEEQILQATVQIAMYEFDAGTGSEIGGQGLGTIVRHNGQTVIITHDHWSHLNANLKVVEFSNAQGGLQLSLNAVEFQSLVQYRDGGTMVLTAPAGLTGFVPVALARPGMVEVGDSVWIARRTPFGNRSTVEVIGAKVEGIQNGNGPAYLQMRGSDNAAVIPGDSGGGVWMNGQLVANNWSSGVVVTQSWFDRLIGSEQVIETNTINAALNPLEGLAGGRLQVDEAPVSNLEGKLVMQ